MRYCMEDALKVAAEVRANNPTALAVRVLDDGSVAMLCDLPHTRAVLLGCTSWGWSRRFCFSDRNLAYTVFMDARSEDRDPVHYGKSSLEAI